MSVRKKLLLMVLCLVLLGGISIGIWASYHYGNDWTGLHNFRRSHGPDEEFERGKTLWDWLNLLIVPAVLTGGVFMLNWTSQRISHQRAEDQRKTDLEIAADRLNEERLQAYLDKMTELLLDQGLRTSEADSEVRDVARARTLTLARILDEKRKGLLLRFLYEAELIMAKPLPESGKITDGIVNLRGVDLSGADLYTANLVEANLIGANLDKANLTGANLRKASLNGASLIQAKLYDASLIWADLSRADLSRADLSEANLHGAILSGTNLSETQVTPEQLRLARSLNGTIMSDDMKNALSSFGHDRSTANTNTPPNESDREPEEYQEK